MIKEHLEQRKLQFHRYPNVSFDDREATFPLFNLSNKIVGVVKYNPEQSKEFKNLKYNTVISQEGDTNSRAKNYMAFWGLESFYYREDVLFVVEGIFKAVPFHNIDVPCIASLSNNPLHLKPFLRILSSTRKIIFVGDNDEGGTKTHSLGYPIVFPPKNYKDVDDMTFKEFLLFYRKAIDTR